jgi:hypothetical protein
MPVLIAPRHDGSAPGPLQESSDRRQINSIGPAGFGFGPVRGKCTNFLLARPAAAQKNGAWQSAIAESHENRRVLIRAGPVSTLGFEPFADQGLKHHGRVEPL